MIGKSIDLMFEDSRIVVEVSGDSGLVTLRVEDYALNEEKSSHSNEVYEKVNSVEVYPDVDELKEIIRALQQIIPGECN